MLNSNKKVEDVLLEVNTILFCIGEFYYIHSNREFWSNPFIYICITLTILVLLLQKCVWQSVVKLFLMIIIVMLTSIHYFNGMIMAYYIFVFFSYRNVKLMKYMKIIMNMMILYFLFILFLTFLNIINNSVFDFDTRERHLLGFISYSAYPNYLLSIILIYYYQFNKKTLRTFDTAIILIVSYIVYIFSDTRTFLLLTLLFVILQCIIGSMHNIKHLMFISVYLPLIFVIISICLLIFFNDSIGILNMISKLLSNRFKLWQYPLQRYSINAFGNLINEFTRNYGFDLYVVDNIFLNILFKRGVCGVLLVIIIFTSIMDYAKKTNDFKLIIIIFIVLCVGFLWNKILSFVDNPFLMFFCKFFMDSRIVAIKNK